MASGAFLLPTFFFFFFFCLMIPYAAFLSEAQVVAIVIVQRRLLLTCCFGTNYMVVQMSSWIEFSCQYKRLCTLALHCTASRLA